MAIIQQKTLFSWEKLEIKSDLEILKLVLENLPDEKIMRELENKRGKGRNDYPIRAVWNSIIAGVVYEHDSVESLIRELKRNLSLREMCGFGITGGTGESCRRSQEKSNGRGPEESHRRGREKGF